MPFYGTKACKAQRMKNKLCTLCLIMISILFSGPQVQYLRKRAKASYRIIERDIDFDSTCNEILDRLKDYYY